MDKGLYFTIDVDELAASKDWNAFLTTAADAVKSQYQQIYGTSLMASKFMTSVMPLTPFLEMLWDAGPIANLGKEHHGLGVYLANRPDSCYHLSGLLPLKNSELTPDTKAVMQGVNVTFTAEELRTFLYACMRKTVENRLLVQAALDRGIGHRTLFTVLTMPVDHEQQAILMPTCGDPDNFINYLQCIIDSDEDDDQTNVLTKARALPASTYLSKPNAHMVDAMLYQHEINRLGRYPQAPVRTAKPPRS